MSAIGYSGAAHAGILLAAALDRAKPDQLIAVMSLADGADVTIWRTTAALAARAAGARSTVAEQVPGSRAISYPTFLTWRGFLDREPPRRPDPARPAAPSALRAENWKFAFAGSLCQGCGTRFLPPQRVCLKCRAVGRMTSVPMADVSAAIATFTVDRLAYSLSPPVVAAVIDFEGGGRFQCELTDVDPSAVRIGDRVEMTFRRLFTAGGVHNYFWKARPVRARRNDRAQHQPPLPCLGEGSRRSIHGEQGDLATAWRSSAWAARPSASTGTRASTTCWSTPPQDASARRASRSTTVDAFWLGTLFSGQSGLTLSRPLKIDYKPVSRLENYCATGSEAFRNACYAVASGAYDMAMAIGVEKLKDSGFSGLPGAGQPGDGTQAGLTAPAMFSLLAPAYAKKYGIDDAQLKEVMTRIAWKNHRNGALNPRAQFRKEVPKDTIACSPLVAGPLGIFDCSGVSDGSAAAIIVRAEDAHRYTDRPLYVKALSFVAGPAAGPIDPDYDYTTFQEVVASAADAYAQAGIKDPRAELAMAEVHDCFTPTELVLMEDLGFAARGTAWKEVLAGTFDLRRRAGRESRRRPQVVRPSHRRLRAPHAVRVLAAAPWRGGHAADRQRGPRSQPRRSPTTWVERRANACRSSASSVPSAVTDLTQEYPHP